MRRGSAVSDVAIERVREILATVRHLAAETLGPELAHPRTPGYDAARQVPDGPQRTQTKGRAYGDDAKPGQRISLIKTDAACDAVLLVLLDSKLLDAREMWEPPFTAVAARLAVPGSKSRDRGALGVLDFKCMARKMWPE
jgi:hypothetical protein